MGYYKDYKIGRFESVDFELNDCGTDEFTLRFDRVLDHAFSSVTLYADSDRTTALTEGSDWEYYTEDSTRTALEAGDDGSGETIYSEIKILNATYQSGAVYGTCNNFGTYTSGKATGVEYEEINETSSYEIDPQQERIMVHSAPTADITITLSNAGHPCGYSPTHGRVTIWNDNSSDYKIIVTDGTTTYWIRAGQTATFCFRTNSSDVETLTWCSAGWETIYYDATSTLTSVPQTSLLRDVEDNTDYALIIKGGTGVQWSGFLSVLDKTDQAYGADLDPTTTDYRPSWNYVSNAFQTIVANFVTEIRQWHDAA